MLSAYCALSTESPSWNLLVVDNASNDATSKIINEYATQLPLQLIRTEKCGKNIALNIGLDSINTESSLIFFSDDDVVPDANWLITMANTAEKHPKFDMFGGHIYPIWPDETPDWIFRLVNMGAVYAITPPQLKSGPVSAAQIWGANMVVRHHLFAKGYRFNEQVGPTQGQYIMGSEVEFNRRLEKDGHQAWFCADASVGHIIRKNQITRDWIIQRAYRLGRHMFHQERTEFKPDIKLIRGAPQWKYRMLLNEVGNLIKAVTFRNQDKKFRASWEISFLKGYLHEAAQNY